MYIQDGSWIRMFIRDMDTNVYTGWIQMFIRDGYECLYRMDTNVYTECIV